MRTKLLAVILGLGIAVFGVTVFGQLKEAPSTQINPMMPRGVRMEVRGLVYVVSVNANYDDQKQTCSVSVHRSDWTLCDNPEFNYDSWFKGTVIPVAEGSNSLFLCNVLQGALISKCPVNLKVVYDYRPGFYFFGITNVSFIISKNTMCVDPIPDDCHFPNSVVPN